MDTRLMARRTLVRRQFSAFAMLVFLAVGFLSQPMLASAQSTLYGPFDDGCYYFWEGSRYVAGLCPQENGTYDYYQPGAGGAWEFAMNFWDDSSGVRHTTLWDGSRMDFYPDGSTVYISASGDYMVRNSLGVATEMGSVDAQGNFVMVGYLGPTGIMTSVNSHVAPSQLETQALQNDLAEVQSQVQGSSDFGTCIWDAPTQDYNDNGRLEQSDPVDFCQR